MGWWNDIPLLNEAWNEIPAPFRNLIRGLEPPKYLVLEDGVDERLLETTCGVEDSNVYVLPAHKSGLDGCYRFLGVLAKSSFTEQNLAGDLDVDSGARKKNLLYTDPDKWFSSVRENRPWIANVLEDSKNKPMLFILTELPFYGPVDSTTPPPQQIAGTPHWIIHVDLKSKLARYLFGVEFLSRFAIFVSELQQMLI